MLKSLVEVTVGEMLQGWTLQGIQGAGGIARCSRAGEMSKSKKCCRWRHCSRRCFAMRWQHYAMRCHSGEVIWQRIYGDSDIIGKHGVA